MSISVCCVGSMPCARNSVINYPVFPTCSMQVASVSKALPRDVSCFGKQALNAVDTHAYEKTRHSGLCKQVPKSLGTASQGIQAWTARQKSSADMQAMQPKSCAGFGQACLERGRDDLVDVAHGGLDALAEVPA